jgi:hypothetical protein
VGDCHSPRGGEIPPVAAVAAAEGRKVMTIDVGGAFLNTDIKTTGILVHVRTSLHTYFKPNVLL